MLQHRTQRHDQRLDDTVEGGSLVVDSTQGTMGNTSGRRRVLVIGRDARTDALAAACAASACQPELVGYSDCRIPGLLEKCIHLEIGRLTDIDAVCRFAAEAKPDLAVIGPAEPLAAGLVNVLEGKLGIACFGPSAELARIESSKAWARQLLDRHAIPGNPRYFALTEKQDIWAALEVLQECVVKPDGLTGGKGVRVLGDHLASLEDAAEYAGTLISSTGCVVLEERLEGEEFSLQTISDGEASVHCPAVRDFKRAFEGDKGPNTGGMGSYSTSDGSLPFLSSGDLVAARRINEMVIQALLKETGVPFSGVLYGGFIATADGVRVIEYNARFGDPEVLNVLPLLRTDFVDLCDHVSNRTLADINVEFQEAATVCKYIVPAGYPDKLASGEIKVPLNLTENRNVRYYWAATNQVEHRVELTSSRALAIVGIGATIAEAAEEADEAAKRIGGGIRYRSDIGSVDLVDRSVDHMRRLRQA